MATYVATAHKLFMGGLDVSCFSNSYNLDLTADPVECTTYCSAGVREYKQGLRSWASSFDGYADFAAAADTASPLVPGEVLTPSNQGSQFNVTWAPIGTEGSWCYLSDGVLGSVTILSGTVGDMAMTHGELVPADRTVGHRMPWTIRWPTVRSAGISSPWVMAMSPTVPDRIVTLPNTPSDR